MSETNYLYFLSYARDDRDNDQDGRIAKFYNDLEGALRRRGATEPGFFDTRSTSTGEFWTPAANHALRTCRVFVSMYSPTYFTRPYCGQEWEVFSRRVEEYRRTAAIKERPMIMPILFVGLPLLKEKLNEMPESIRDIVYRFDDDPEVYINDGLEVFMLSKYRDDYEVFVGRFATRLLELAKKHPLPAAADSTPSVADVKSAFHIVPSRRARRPNPPAQSTDFVEFLFLVGNRTEMEKIRDCVDSYGNAGADWKAYEPLLEDKIGYLAQAIANKEKFLSTIVTPIDDLKEWLDEAKKKNHIAAIVVDSWSLQEPNYAKIGSDYDYYDSIHSLMLVCMNRDDRETKNRATDLAKQVSTVFQTKVTRGANSNFMVPVGTSEQFETHLSATLGKIRMDLLAANIDRLKNWYPDSTQGNSQSEPTVALPSINTSGGV